MSSIDLGEISGKWALVTGASRGIGLHVCRGLASYGCNLVLHSRNEASTASLATELRAGGAQVVQVGAELSDANQVDALVRRLVTEGPPIDILYNNAAIMTPYRSNWLDVPAEDYRASFEVNVIALTRICHGLLPGMIARGWGRVVNVTSGIADNPELIAYAISKAAVDKFVRDSASKLAGTGVAMNLLDPGWLKTDMGGANAPGEVESVLPGALVPALMAEAVSGQLFRAQDWAGKSL